MALKKKKIILLCITISLLLPFSLLTPIVNAEISYNNEISVEEVYKKINCNRKKYSNLVLLDVRSPQEYKLGHIDNSILIPHDKLEARIDELEEYKDSEIIVYCKSGTRSKLACETLIAKGFTKIYNMEGGIVAWIDKDYPIWTTSHYITVDKLWKQSFQFQIEPMLKYYSGCISCSENNESNIEGDSFNYTTEILEQEDDHLKILIVYKINESIIEMTVLYTLLWDYVKIMNDRNKTGLFFSIEFFSEALYMKIYRLMYLVQTKEYIMTVDTDLFPLNSEYYNSSSTVVTFEFIGGKEITSLEIIEFNTPVSLSQHYSLLGRISNRLAHSYKRSGDKNLRQLTKAYRIMKRELLHIALLVKTQLSEYDLLIFNASALLSDVCGDPICITICNWIHLLGCSGSLGLVCTLTCSVICAPTGFGFPWCLVLCTFTCSAIGGAICTILGIYGNIGCGNICCMI